MRISRLFLSLVLSVSLHLAAQNVPPLINYQGRLANPDGSALSTANFELTFKIYDSAQNGSLLWGPQIFDGIAALGHGSQIPVVNGYFNVMLGPVDISNNSLATAFAGTNCYVEITVTNNAPISPRQRILTTPFAFQAGYAATAGVASNVSAGISITNAVMSGSINLPGLATIYLGSNLLVRADGSNNFFAGDNSGNTALTGSQNVGVGDDALVNLTTGFDNSAVGFYALKSATTSDNNTALGTWALSSDTTGRYNTAVGSFTLVSNNGNANTAVGTAALESNTNGSDNVAVGYNAMGTSISGSSDTAVGYGALGQNTTGNSSTAVGSQALYYNTTGLYNTATGAAALYSNTIGSYNIALGNEAGQNVTIGNNNIEIGNKGTASDNNTIYLGAQGTQTNTVIAGISGTSITGGLPVYVNSSGQLGNQTVKQWGTNVPAGGIAVSASCGLFSNSTPSASVMISNFNVTIATQGNPVEVSFVSDGNTSSSGNEGYFEAIRSSGDVWLSVWLYRDGNLVGKEHAEIQSGNTQPNVLYASPGAFKFLDLSAAAATHTYYAVFFADSNTTALIAEYMRMIVREY